MALGFWDLARRSGGTDVRGGVVSPDRNRPRWKAGVFWIPERIVDFSAFSGSGALLLVEFMVFEGHRYQCVFGTFRLRDRRGSWVRLVGQREESRLGTFAAARDLQTEFAGVGLDSVDVEGVMSCRNWYLQQTSPVAETLDGNRGVE